QWRGIVQTLSPATLAKMTGQTVAAASLCVASASGRGHTRSRYEVYTESDVLFSENVLAVARDDQQAGPQPCVLEKRSSSGRATTTTNSGPSPETSACNAAGKT